MRIKKVEIYNFRNFCGKYSFNLDKNITILYGENGYGKSTFFDAIEWCITNEIERFKTQDGEVGFSNNDCINNKAKEDLEPECYVSLYYDNYQLLRKYTANSKYTSVSLYNCESENRVLITQGQKNVEKELSKYKEEKSNGAKLIKQSYVLSQDQITNFIRSNPRDRFDSLASIMGINKVTNFIDNLKTTNSIIQSTHESLGLELDNNRKLIESHIADREESIQLENRISEIVESLEKSESESIKKDINLTMIDAEVNNTNLAIVKNKKILSVFKDIPLEFNEYNDLKAKQLILDDKYDSKINVVAKAEESKLSAEKEIKGIESTFKKISEEKKLLTKVEKERSEIDKVRADINKKELGKLDNEELRQKLKNSRKKLEVANFTLLYIDDYHKFEKEYKETPDMNKEIQKEVNILERKIRSREKLILSLKKWLTKNNASSSLQGLIQYLQGISNYVKSNDVHGTCPVCSSYVGDSLDKEIQNNITLQTSRVTNLELRVVRAYELQEKIENELSAFRRDLQKNVLELKKLTRVFENALNTLDSISKNIQFDLKLFNKSKNEIVKIQNGLIEEVQSIEAIIGEKSKLASLENDFKTLLENLNLKKSEGEVEVELEFKKNSLYRKIRRIDKLIEKINQDIILIKKDRDIVSLHISSINRLEGFSHNNKEFAIINRQLKNELSNLENKFLLLSQIKELSIKKNEKRGGLQRLLSYEETEKELIMDIKTWKEKGEELDTYIKGLTAKVGIQALDFLNDPHSKIQQYYRYLNPMPTTNGNIHFLTENSDDSKRGLTITIPYKKNNGNQEFMNARYTLSSAQLNTLAIAIFLVANDSQDVGILDFVAIDDPIQNMDDVNQYTMCDILGDINKQLLFSTHSLDFLKLFIKKNDYKKSDIRVYFLEAPNLIEGRVKEVTF
ncbi:AAA family ATPase [Planococcus alpniumensis]|uniref:AAA family ATPase n=1 Tax=Planococcus alpniumensis TaxID=2708345 RepID=UPI001B8C32A6|nr:SMC family ATPase [Planococcus sp. MSAK28401]